MATLSEFALQQGINTIPKGVGNLSDFAKQNKQGIFGWIGKQLMKPVGFIAKETRGIGEAIGNLLSITSSRIDASQGLKTATKALVEAQIGAFDVLRGEEETSFIQEFKKAGIEPTALDKVMGLGADIILDPLNIIPVGKVAKTVGKVAEKAGEITKLAEPTKKLADIIKDAPVIEKIKMLFSNTTGNKEFDKIVSKFRNLKEYREGQLLDQAVKLQKDIKQLGKQGIRDAEEIITEGLENPKFRATIENPTIKNWIETLKNTYKDLLNQSRNVGLKVGEIMEYAPHIRTKESFINTLVKDFGIGAKEFTKGSIEKGRKLEGTIKELGQKGIDIFEKNPAIQLVKKGQAYAKAITSNEFANAVKQFAVKEGFEVTHPVLRGLKFDEPIAKVIDNYYQGIKPEELKVILKGFDKVQNWWKAQALISPSYHLRNVVGNLWNNFIAGVNPAYYFKAGHLQKGTLEGAEIIDEMKRLGVINEGWYAKDIGEEVLSRVDRIGNWKKAINPLSQQNALFRLNKAGGSIIENNARMAHYLAMKDKGMTTEQAAESVKKYLFDYGDLTKFEQNIMKRIAPFYTWTRKNIPLQLEGLITQPAKYVLPHKIVENLEAGVEQPNEKYMSYYIKENIPVRIRKNEKGNTEYFLLGNWLPYASAIDVLSHPLDTIVQMASPLIKIPIEQWSNKSSFWKDSLGQYQEIERGGKEYGEFLGNLMRKRNIQLLSNIRILNDINKWVEKKDPTATQDTWIVKTLNTLFGKTATYDVGKSKYYYDRDTEDYIADIKKAIKTAEKKGYKDKANDLRDELNEVVKIRRGD